MKDFPEGIMRSPDDFARYAGDVADYISQLERENEALQRRIDELEAENQDLANQLDGMR